MEASLEIRQVGGVRELVGRFPYRERATISDRDSVRKEEFEGGAFDFALNEPTRKIDVLIGHDFGKPVASRQSGTLVIQGDNDSVWFTATLPPDELTPSWVMDAERAIANGTMTGLSPGFRVPPRSAVPNAVTLYPEPGNPGVQVRRVNHAVLREFSVVTAGTYEGASVELRAEGEDFEDGELVGGVFIPMSIYQWL